MDVTGKKIEFYSNRRAELEKYNEIRVALCRELGEPMSALLTPSSRYTTPPKQISAGRLFMEKTNGVGTRRLTKKDVKYFTGEKQHDEMVDFRELGRLLFDNKDRSWILNGMGQFLNYYDKEDEDVVFYFHKSAYNALRRHIRVIKYKSNKLDNGEEIDLLDQKWDKMWQLIIGENGKFVNSFMMPDGSHFEIYWKTVEVESDGGKVGKSLSILSHYFFNNRKGEVNFLTLRKTSEKLYFNTKDFGVAWYLILDSIYHNMYEAPFEASRKTIISLKQNE